MTSTSAPVPGGLALKFKPGARIVFLGPRTRLLAMFDSTIVPSRGSYDTKALACPGCALWQVQVVAVPTAWQMQPQKGNHQDDEEAARALAWEHLGECEPLAMLAGLQNITPVDPPLANLSMRGR